MQSEAHMPCSATMRTFGCDHGSALSNETGWTSTGGCDSVCANSAATILRHSKGLPTAAIDECRLLVAAAVH
ncbi:hypothetical protein OEZ85_009169 [Tetradesmus obliquus]|uniref:Uncharacterized protein n=1 Tax=Tetradesmus obliquus TaxID=3088 RepID=A0ABY8TKZ0_TETOB|nr:hypothetical protein OEZ85_009169 [Tetradesmus obliquus]